MIIKPGLYSLRMPDGLPASDSLFPTSSPAARFRSPFLPVNPSRIIACLRSDNGRRL